MILVTHDQSEAMSFADEVVVMKDGEIQQSGAPEELFPRPANEFVSYLIGSPPLNLFAVERRGDRLTVPALGHTLDATGSAADESERVGARPEHIRLLPAGDGTATAWVEKVENLGVDAIYALRSPGGERFKVKSRHLHGPPVGDEVGLQIADTELLLFRQERLVPASGA